MGVFEFAAFATICWALVEIFGSKKKNKKTTQREQQLEQDNESLTAEMQELKQRVEVLEKIVTDKSYDLKRQIDDL